MPAIVMKFVPITVAILVIAATAASAQTRHRRVPHEAEHASPVAPTDKRDSVVAAPSTFAGKPYWLAMAQCGGIYFKLNLLYTDLAVRARSVKPDPRVNAEYTKKLNDAIETATTYFDATERFLMTDRGLERQDAVLAYDPQSRAEEDRLKTIDAALAATKVCPILYRACQQAYSKVCTETLAPES
jgi:hypothetical protein